LPLSCRPEAATAERERRLGDQPGQSVGRCAINRLTASSPTIGSGETAP
jgi:hypothetical protein